MKQIVRIVAALFGITFLSVFSGCTFDFIDFSVKEQVFAAAYDSGSASGLTDSTVKEQVFTVNYDYGLYAEGKATLLLDSCNFFFAPADYNIDYIVAGDKISVKYTGEMLVAESYPGIISLNGRIVDVKIEERAEVLTLQYTSGEEEGNFSVLENTVTAAGAYDVVAYPEYVITSVDGDFCALSEIEDGATLYATYRKSEIGSKTEPATDDAVGYKLIALYTSYEFLE